MRTLSHESMLSVKRLRLSTPRSLLPLGGVGPVCDEPTGMVVTLWRRVQTDDRRQPSALDIASALRRLHDALTRCEGIALPSFRTHLSSARSALDDDRAMEALPPLDRSLLRQTYDREMADLDDRVFDERPLHGEPHMGNLLGTSRGVTWIDLENACSGPLEWDLACVTREVAALFPEADATFVERLRMLNSARVATWCWVRADVPEMRRHGEHHLDVIRDRVIATSRDDLRRSYRAARETSIRRWRPFCATLATRLP